MAGEVVLIHQEQVQRQGQSKDSIPGCLRHGIHFAAGALW